MSAKNVNSDTFNDIVLKSDTPVLVDFWADWCGPCRMMSPVLEEISTSSKEFKVCKVNVDEEEDLADRFEISSIPCLVVFKNGAEAKRSTGVIPKDAVLELVRSV